MVDLDTIAAIVHQLTEKLEKETKDKVEMMQQVLTLAEMVSDMTAGIEQLQKKNKELEIKIQYLTVGQKSAKTRWHQPDGSMLSMDEDGRFHIEYSTASTPLMWQTKQSLRSGFGSVPSMWDASPARSGFATQAPSVFGSPSAPLFGGGTPPVPMPFCGGTPPAPMGASSSIFGPAPTGSLFSGAPSSAKAPTDSGFFTPYIPDDFQCATHHANGFVPKRRTQSVRKLEQSKLEPSKLGEGFVPVPPTNKKYVVFIFQHSDGWQSYPFNVVYTDHVDTYKDTLLNVLIMDARFMTQHQWDVAQSLVKTDDA